MARLQSIGKKLMGITRELEIWSLSDAWNLCLHFGQNPCNEAHCQKPDEVFRGRLNKNFGKVPYQKTRDLRKSSMESS